MSVITLLTDFGTADSYVGELKGVLASAAPAAVVVDITHEIPPGDARAAQFVLSRVWHRFPEGTVHLAVVDPGVGTARRALAAKHRGHLFLAPDNGLLTFLVPPVEWAALRIPAAAAPTFHGRDVFAPAAARLATGTPLQALGPPVTDPYHSPLPTPRRQGEGWVGEVVYVDRFGTLITNLPGELVEPETRITVGATDVGTLQRTFGDVVPGAFVAFVGSGGTVEVAVRDGSAARRLGLGVGAPVRA